MGEDDKKIYIKALPPTQNTCLENDACNTLPDVLWWDQW